MLGILEKNLETLEKKYPDLYRRLKRKDIGIPENLEVLDCRDGNKTLKAKCGGRMFLLHSMYDPVAEAERFAREKINGASGINLLYGFGMGYHVRKLLDLLPDNGELHVFDINSGVFVAAMMCNDLTDIVSDRRVTLEISDSLGDILPPMEKLLTKECGMNVILHVPSVQIIPDEMEDFKFVMEDWNIRKSVDEKYGSLLSDNRSSNLLLLKRNVGEFFDKFTGMPFLIVSAGPSLEKNVDLIKEIEGRAVIISAGSALKFLLKRGIKPDFFVLIDPMEIIYKQVEGIEDIDVTAIFLSTACRLAVQEYKGPKFAAIQDESHMSDGEEKFLIKTGGSVATTALDIALKMGANPVIFVGQDLAYQGDKHHISEYVHNDYLGDIKPVDNMRKVKGQDGELLNTTLGLLSYKRWIENRIRDEADVVFINSTEGGAFIKGAKHISLKETIDTYLTRSYHIKGMIDSVINNQG